jgi:3-oxoadipate enol-lactonase
VVEQTTWQRNHPDPAWLERLADITAPTLVVAGGATSHLPQDQVAELASRIPAAQLITVDAGHEIHATRPEEFVAAVTAFLRI